MNEHTPKVVTKRMLKQNVNELGYEYREEKYVDPMIKYRLTRVFAGDYRIGTITAHSKPDYARMERIFDEYLEMEEKLEDEQEAEMKVVAKGIVSLFTSVAQ